MDIQNSITDTHNHIGDIHISINPHPVMPSDLHGPRAGPQRPGSMIFKCVEFLVQLKNKNSSYWLSHITTALNCKIYLIFLASVM